MKKMNTIKRYRPAFFSGFDNEVVDFFTKEELLNIPFVKNFMFGDFSHYAIYENRLMAIYDDGYIWYTVGFIEEPDKVDLPKWDGGKYRDGR